jgi:alanyl-tRNA synthetase
VQGSEIRELFLRFFEERGHTRVRSSSLIPPPETGLLLTNAGMNQFIPYFLGQAEPPYRRATSAQKVMRTGDIDNVGRDSRHETFFEMLGNFSFGDYFKADAIAWAYELVTTVYGIEAGRLWATVYRDDDEAAEAWLDVGIPSGRIVRRGRFDAEGESLNYWWTHAAGPAGPCSEIFVDRGSKYGRDGGPDVDEERFLEIWNLVFIQDQVDGNADLVAPLPAKNVDTGANPERIAMILQDVDNVFETDLLRPLLQVAEDLSSKTHGHDRSDDISLKIIAEHGRATTFLVADGVLPSNEGRGYILRRMLRRVVSHARRLGVNAPVVEAIAERTIELFGDAYPELRENREFVLQVLGSEEERFSSTLRQGMTLLEQEIEKPEWESHSGDIAFQLHDTFGFPIELTRELLDERGLTLDTDRFVELMEEQRRRAQEAAKKGAVGEQATGDVAARVGATEFLGYQTTSAEARVEALFVGTEVDAAHEGQDVLVLLNRTPFYAEGGGQVGDHGVIRTAGGVIRVNDTKPGPGDTIVHEGRVESGEVQRGETAQADVDPEFRQGAARSHTATHVVHWTLRHLLGEHARQAGSLVQPGRLRFDFTHHQGVPRNVLEAAEYTANGKLADDDPVRAYETTIEYARGEGAIALFGEKYGDIVRVVEIGDYSKELCGGTHVPHTGKVAVVRILGEGSIGSGMRRIEALVGPDALEHINTERRLLEEVTAALGAGDPQQAPERARRAIERVKQLESELGKLHKEEQKGEIERLLDTVVDVDGAKVLVEYRPGSDASTLRDMALRLKSYLANDPAAIVLATSGDGRSNVVVALTKALLDRGLTASDLALPVAVAVGGRAGGKPDLAIGGGPKEISQGDLVPTVHARLHELLTT